MEMAFVKLNNMRVKTTILAILTLLVVPTIFIVVWQDRGLEQIKAQTTLPPVLFFSDLTSGPDIGWSVAEPNKGAAISV